MKKCVILCVLLALALCACGKAQPQAETPALYYNLQSGQTLTPDAGGVYTLDFAVGSEKKTFTVTDETLAEQLQLLDFVGLTLEGDRITGITRMPDLPYSRVAWNWYVQSIGGNTVKANVMESFAGKEVVLKLPEGLPVYDITAAGSFGSLTQMQKNDCISVIADESGEMLFAYVTARPAVDREGTAYCAHCDSQVRWMDWVSESTLPASAGHYILQKDVQLQKTTRLTGGEVCLELNGKTVKQNSDGERIYYISGEATLSIMDSAGGAVLLPANGYEEYSYRKGMAVQLNHPDAVLNLYGGTLDASAITSENGSAVCVSSGTFNLYDGTVLGGTVYGTGSSAITATDRFNMYGGRVVGGRHVDTGFALQNPPGGGTIRVLGTTTIYGGIIEGGESYCEGGVIRLSTDAQESSQVKLILKGGTITGGKAPVGGGIYAKSGSSIVISGDVKITGSENGNLFLEEGVSLTVEALKEGAQIGITMEKDGVFAAEVPEGVDPANCFVSDVPGKKIVSTAKGWELK